MYATPWYNKTCKFNLEKHKSDNKLITHTGRHEFHEKGDKPKK